MGIEQRLERLERVAGADSDRQLIVIRRVDRSTMDTDYTPDELAVIADAENDNSWVGLRLLRLPAAGNAGG